MSTSKPSINYCRHILVEAEYLLTASAGLPRERFLSDETLKRAFVRSLEIVGEAVKQVPEGFPAPLSSSGMAEDGRDPGPVDS